MRLLANSRFESFFDPYFDANLSPLVQQEIANSNRNNNNNNNNNQQQQQNADAETTLNFDDIVDEFADFAVAADNSNQSNNNQNITTNTKTSDKT
eukprot:UN03432